MNLKDFKFPVLTGADMVFCTLKADPILLEEAKARGFYDNSSNPYVKIFKELFYNGGKVKFRKDIDSDFKEKAWIYCRSFMGSFEPSQEDKTAICAMLMSELLEPELDK